MLKKQVWIFKFPVKLHASCFVYSCFFSKPSVIGNMKLVLHKKSISFVPRSESPTYLLDEFCSNAQFYAKSKNCGKNDRKLWNDRKILTLMPQICDFKFCRHTKKVAWIFLISWLCTIFRFSIILWWFCHKNSAIKCTGALLSKHMEMSWNCYYHMEILILNFLQQFFNRQVLKIYVKNKKHGSLYMWERHVILRLRWV